MKVEINTVFTYPKRDLRTIELRKKIAAQDSAAVANSITENLNNSDLACLDTTIYITIQFNLYSLKHKLDFSNNEDGALIKKLGKVLK